MPDDSLPIIQPEGMAGKSNQSFVAYQWLFLEQEKIPNLNIRCALNGPEVRVSIGPRTTIS